jgi:endonuclease/exonuclease/phosphatase family metal-dependent hydrolase
MDAKPTNAPVLRARVRLLWRSWVSVLIAMGLVALYGFRPLLTEGITIWPAWIWAIPGLVLVLDRPKKLWKSVRWPLVAWLVLTLSCSEVWRIVLPGGFGDHDLRIVSLNTGGFMEGAMKETASLSPDIVLLQESAELPDQAAAIKRTYGEGYQGVVGYDGSIFVRGMILSSYAKQSNFVIARVRLRDGKELDVVSLRLNAPLARIDYWRKECWQAYTQHRTEHLEELRELWRRVQDHRTGAPLVMGGDFNLVPDAGEVEILGSELVDSYRVAGRGWYATALEGARLFRIDKVWCSKELQPKGTFAHDSEPSDHRYVVAQFDWVK